VGSDTRYFVQLRFPKAAGWTTVAVASTRQSARDDAQNQAVEVRIVSEEQLLSRQGAVGVDAALNSLAEHGFSA
jgi:hypothetical protein